jgi:hypothetical protein
VLEAAEKINGTIVGCRFSIKKEWAALNARVELVYMDHRVTEEINIDRFIESLAIRFPSKESSEKSGRRISRLSM